MKLSFDFPDFSAVADELEGALQEAMTRAAERLPYDACELLRQGVAPDGTPQPQLDAEYAAEKQREGYDDTPGVRTGRLTDPERWRVEAAGGEASVRLPADRERVAGYLEARGYRFQGIPAETRRYAQDVLEDEVQQAIDRGLRRRRRVG